MLRQAKLNADKERKAAEEKLKEENAKRADQAQDTCAVLTEKLARMVSIVTMPWAAHGHPAIRRFGSLEEMIEMESGTEPYSKPFVVENVELGTLAATMGSWTVAAKRRQQKTTVSLITAELAEKHGKAVLNDAVAQVHFENPGLDLASFAVDD